MAASLSAIKRPYPQGRLYTALRRIGEISFSLYLIHALVIDMVQATGLRFANFFQDCLL